MEDPRWSTGAVNKILENDLGFNLVNHEDCIANWPEVSMYSYGDERISKELKMHYKAFMAIKIDHVSEVLGEDVKKLDKSSGKQLSVKVTEDTKACQKKFLSYFIKNTLDKNSLVKTRNLFKKYPREMGMLTWNRFNKHLFKDAVSIYALMDALLKDNLFFIDKGPLTNIFPLNIAEKVSHKLLDYLEALAKAPVKEISGNVRNIDEIFEILVDTSSLKSNRDVLKKDDVTDALEALINSLKISKNVSDNVMNKLVLKHLSLIMNSAGFLFSECSDNLFKKGYEIKFSLKKHDDDMVASMLKRTDILEKEMNSFIHGYLTKLKSNSDYKKFNTLEKMPVRGAKSVPVIENIFNQLASSDIKKNPFTMGSYTNVPLIGVSAICNKSYPRIVRSLTKSRITDIENLYIGRVTFIQLILSVPKNKQERLVRLLREMFAVIKNRNEDKLEIAFLHLNIDSIEALLDYILYWYDRKSGDQLSSIWSDETDYDNKRNKRIKALLDSQRFNTTTSMLDQSSASITYQFLYEDTFLDGLDLRNSTSHGDADMYENPKRYSRMLFFWLLSLIDEIFYNIWYMAVEMKKNNQT